MIRATLPVIAAALFCTACEPVHLTGSPNANRNAGALGGAVAGAVAGTVIGGGPRSAAIGAAAGAAVGAGVGALLDRQAADLRQDLGNDAITVTNTGESLLVNFPQEILFAVDSSAVSAASRDELRALAGNLQQYPDTTVEIIGHTDNTGAASYNADLSAQRAGAVTGVLINAGVAGWRVTPIGRGEDQPVASNLTEEGRALNRRVEVVIRPST